MIAPLAFSEVDVPAQTVAVPIALTVGTGFTVTVTVRVAEQLPVAPVIVYVVVADGLATGFAMVASLRPVAGLHV